MGCDIHFHVETREYDDQPWRSVYRPEKKDWGADNYYGYSGRNYRLFAMLADVRNDGGIEPICTPRGLPKDLSADVAADYECWRGDAHSSTHFLLPELLAFDWGREATIRGLLSRAEYEDWTKRRAVDPKAWPSSWCGGVGGNNTAVVTQAQAERGEWPEGKNAYVECIWRDSYKSACGGFDKTLERLEELAAVVGGPQNVRVVFWFDN